MDDACGVVKVNGRRDVEDVAVKVKSDGIKLLKVLAGVFGVVDAISVLEAGSSEFLGDSVEEERRKGDEERVADLNLVGDLFFRWENFFASIVELHALDSQTPVELLTLQEFIIIFDVKLGIYTAFLGIEGSSAKEDFVEVIVGEVEGNGFVVDDFLVFELPKVARSLL